MSTSAGVEAPPPTSAPAPATSSAGRRRTPRGAVAWAVVVVGALVAAAMITGATNSLVGAAVRRHTTGGVVRSGVRAVEVDALRCPGDVTVRAGSTDESGSAGSTGEARSTGQAAVRWRDTWERHRPSHHESVDGSGLLSVQVRCPASDLGWSSASDLVLTVPVGADVTVTAGSGDVTTQGLDHFQHLHTGSGDLAVTSTGSGPLRLSTGSGDVRVRRSGASDVVATSGAGDVQVAMTTPPQDVAASTGSGDVVIEVPPAPAAGATGPGYAVAARTASGSLHVGVENNPGASRHLSLRSGAGDLQVRAAR